MSVQINVAANQAALTASIQAGVQAYNQRFAQNNQLNLTINPRAFSQPLGRITGDVKDFEAALAASNARVIAFGASTAVLGGVIRSFKELANVTIEVEKNLADINRVFGLTTSQLQKFSTDLFNVTKQTASSFNDASQAALEFSRQGLKAEETLQRTKDALTLTRLAGISTANAVDALTSTVNGFAATGITTSQILNKLVAVEQDFAVGAGDLAEALSRTGQAAQEAGVSLDQLNALVTSAQQSTARGGAVIGNALKTIFTRLQRTDTLDQLEAFNISVRDVQGNILPAVTILQNFAGAYKNLADAQRAQLSEQVAGVYQVNILKAIVNDLNKSQGVYAGALQRGAMATNEAEVATAKLNQTLDALLKQTATSTQQLANNIGKVTFEPLARYGTEQLKSLVESMNEILEGEGIGSTFANGLLKGIRNILAGPGAIAAFFTLFKLIQNSFTYLTQALPQIAGITTETQNRKNIEQSILQIMAQQGPVAQALAGTMGNQAAQAQLLLQVARQQTAEYQTQTALARQLAAQLAGQGVRVRGSGGLQVTRAGGYIPASTKLAEVVGAQAGGYSPGRVVPSPVGGVMNTAEDVKYIPGFAQPFINPPARSKAGRAHRQNAINRTGVDPYIANGFIPNFAKLDEGDYTFASQSGGRFDKKQRSNNSYSILINKVSSDSLGAEKDLDLVGRNLDAGFNNQTKKPNTIYDWVSGIIDVRKFLNKDQVDSAITNLWTGLLKNDKNLIKKGQSIGLSNNDLAAVINTTKRKVGFTLSELKEKYRLSLNPQDAQDNEYFKYKNSNKSGIKAGDPIKTAEGFEKSLNGDYQNFIGDAYEKLVSKIPGVSDKFVISQKQTSPADLIPDPAFIGPHLIQGIESKAGGAFLSQLIKKAIRINIKSRADDNRDEDLNFGTLPVYQPFGSDIQTSFRGFIPNFAPPTSAIRVPWFKKFGNPAFDTIQPTLGISKASDTDTFRSSQFRSKAFDKAAIDGDPNLFAPLYEDFAFKAMQLISQSDIKDDLMRGYVLQPGTDQKQAALDAVYRKKGIGVEYKGYPKKNLTGTIGGELKRKYETLSKTNPEEAAKLQELIIAFNEVGHENQLPSAFGKNFTQLAGTSYSQMVKNSPDLVKGLSAETNMLLERYVKDPNFLRMNAAGGFIPNFANPKIKINSGKDAVESFYSKGSEVKGKKLTGGVKAFPVPETTDLYSVGSSSVSIPGSGFGISLYDAVLAEVSKKGAWLTSDRFTISDKARRIWDGYRKLRKGDVKNKKLPMKHWFLDPAFNNGSYEFPMNPQDLSKNKSTWPPENDPVWSLQYAYQFKKSQLENKMSSGFIPNFANYNTDALERMTMEFAQKGKNGATLQDFTQFVIDLNNNKYGIGDSFHKDIIAKNFGEIVSDNDLVSPRYANTYLKGSYDKNSGKVIYYKSKIQELDPLFERKYSYIKTAVEDKLRKRFPKPVQRIQKPPSQRFRDQHLYPSEENHFNNGFIPNFNFIKGRNSFQKNWLIETAKKRNLNLNDPNTFSKLATEFAKTYPNDQGMFGLNKGFIPNFAYKQAVMGLEESMSGNKAIFDTKPFPHIRNSSQPTFSSAISDHGGLSNALSDSMRGQKAAGLMSRGFIPNFADSNINVRSLLPNAPKSWSASIDKAQNALMQLADELLKNKTKVSQYSTELAKVAANNKVLNSILPQLEKQLIQEVNEKKKSILNQKLSSVGTTLAIAGPLIAGQLEQMAFGNRQRTEMTAGERVSQSVLSSGLTSVTTGASIGASFGPWGAAIGAAAGAAVGLAQALGAASLSADEFAKIAEEYKSATQQNVSAGQSYIDSLKILGSSTDPEIIKKASTSLELNFKNIKDVKLQDAFKAAGNDVDKLTKALSTYEQKRGRIEAQKSSLAQSKALAGLDIKDLGKRGYATVKSGPRNAIDIAANEANFSMMASEYSTFFDNINSLTADQYKELKEALNKMEFTTGNVDEANLRKVLMTFSQLDKESVDYLVGIGENITEVGSTAGRVLRNNLDKVREAYKKNLEQGKGVLSPEEKLILSNFAEFRKNLLNTISDDLNNATQALKSFDSGTSLAQLVPTKLKEINDLVSNSILNNLDTVRGLSFKQAQAKTTAQFQTQEFNRLTTRTVQEQGLKTTQANTLFKSQATQAILGSELIPGISSQEAIQEFLSQGTGFDKQGIKSFATKLAGKNNKEVEALSSKLEGILIQFKESTREIESQTKYKLQELSYNQVINKLNEITILKQIDLEKEKLKITLGQKDAANGLRDAVEKAKIAANERLELTRIQTGGEFRYLGLNKRQEFESRQVDLKSIFDQEQVIAENQAIADARRSIIEIAAQNANTEAQNKNTEALFDSIDSNSANFEYLGKLFSNLPDAGMKEVGAGFVSAAQEAKAKNKFNREQFKQSRESIQFAKLSNFGVQDNSTVGDTIAKLRTKMEEKNITEEAKISIQETITTLEIASKQIGSNATIFEAKSAQMRQDFEQSAGFINNMVIGFNSLGNQADVMVDQLGRNLPSMFADGLVDGIKAAIRESDNLGEALMSIAAKFLDEISTTLMRSSVYQILGSMGIGSSIPIQKQKGGVIRAQSGMYISGSGSGDKYPALLENGEYVLNRRAVMAMGGPASLDQLNFAMAPRFASGGSFGNEFTDLKSMESNMTSYGMENSKLYNELRDAEVSAAEERRRKAFARKQQRAALIGSVVAAVASIGLAQGMSNFSQNAQAKKAQTLSGKLTSGAALTKAESASIKPLMDKGFINSYGQYAGPQPQTGFRSFISKPFYSSSIYGANPYAPAFASDRKQSGGLIGSRLSDTIPGYMEGGLYNTPIVKRYGVGMQSGGASPISNSNSNVVNTTNATNSFNFNTNVSRDGTIEVGSNSTSYAQQDVALSKNLNSKVYAVVLDAIKNEQRFGGSLAGTRQG